MIINYNNEIAHKFSLVEISDFYINDDSINIHFSESELKSLLKSKIEKEISPAYDILDELEEKLSKLNIKYNSALVSYNNAHSQYSVEAAKEEPDQIKLSSLQGNMSAWQDELNSLLIRIDDLGTRISNINSVIEQSLNTFDLIDQEIEMVIENIKSAECGVSEVIKKQMTHFNIKKHDCEISINSIARKAISIMEEFEYANLKYRNQNNSDFRSAPEVNKHSSANYSDSKFNDSKIIDENNCLSITIENGITHIKILEIKDYELLLSYLNGVNPQVLVYASIFVIKHAVKFDDFINDLKDINYNIQEKNGKYMTTIKGDYIFKKEV